VTRPGDGESTLSRVIRIFDAFDSDRPQMTVSEIARRSGLHVATASRLIEQLVGFGLLQRTPDRGLRVGIRMWELASRASPTLGLREAALPFMEDLHAVLGHHTQLGILEGEEVLFVERLSAPGAVVNYTRVAGRLPLHASSSGLVLLAHAPASLQEKILEGPLATYTSETISTSRELRGTLADVRRQGFAFCRGHIHTLAAGIAVPLRDPSGSVVATLAVIVPNDDAAFGKIPALQAAARGIGRAMVGTSGPDF
jgi:DNA-binding IclR family transcriptional regulator